MRDDNQKDGGERKMYQGNWTCGKCGGEIKELPFEPDPNRMDQLSCKDCYRKKQDQYRR